MKSGQVSAIHFRLHGFLALYELQLVFPHPLNLRHMVIGMPSIVG
jgi:hypothetical protein